MMESAIHPLTALLVTMLVLGLLTIFFYPETGLLARWRNNRKNTERILIEDALKHIHHCEYNQVNCTLHSIAGHLSTSGDKAAKLIGRLHALGLIQPSFDNINLTTEGRSYALRVIRVHRLWERYLADETGVEEEHWHLHAEIKEHEVSLADANRLSEKLGHPLTDPHGDPIPSSTGEVAERSGIPIGELDSGTFARILHIEDEPQIIYSQLVALGLYRGMQVRVLDRTNEKLIIEADGNERILSPLFANHIHVETIRHKKEIQHHFATLTTLKEGKKASVVAVSRKIRGQQRRRLMDLGFVPGSEVTSMFKSAGEGLVAFQIRGAMIALRKSQSDGIFIHPVEDKSHDS